MSGGSGGSGVGGLGNEISLVIPLSALAGVSNLEPHKIVEVLTKSVERERELEETKSRLEVVSKMLASYGRSLKLIVEEVNDPYEKAQALRKLSKEMQDIVIG